MSFLNRIWDLYGMPSTDERFNTLYEDIEKHVDLNDDWDYDKLFLGKLKLADDDELFTRFLLEVVDTQNFTSSDDQEQLSELLNSILIQENLKLSPQRYNEDHFAEFALKKFFENGPAINFELNKIPFFVEKNPKGYSHRKDSHSIPPKFPAFVLVADSWNDFFVYSRYDLFFYRNAEDCCYIGPLKILHSTEKTQEEVDKTHYSTNEYLPNDFTDLNGFCSLGQTSEYYRNIARVFSKDYLGILWALRDMAVFPAVNEQYEGHFQMHSLIRNDEAERMLREARLIVKGIPVQDCYKFRYTFTPKYSHDSVEFSFNFDNDDFFPNRIYALIGENGVGKTNFISTLPLDIAYGNKDSFNPNVPQFSKVIAISCSYYDHFKIPQATASFNYRYYGLSKMEGGVKKVMTEVDMMQAIRESIKEIQCRMRVKSLQDILKIILPSDFIDKLFFTNPQNAVEIKTESLATVCPMLSSGQFALLFIFCSVIANIRYDSLLLFDEPETHLHPNAISTLIKALNELLDKYQSYCILTTHSPLIVRELLSRNVYVMERIGEIPNVGTLSMESLGENLTVLTEEIFGNSTVRKHFACQIQSLIDRGYSEEHILRRLSTHDVPVSLSLRIFIHNLFLESETSE